MLVIQCRCLWVKYTFSCLTGPLHNLLSIWWFCKWNKLKTLSVWFVLLLCLLKRHPNTLWTDFYNNLIPVVLCPKGNYLNFEYLCTGLGFFFVRYLIILFVDVMRVSLSLCVLTGTAFSILYMCLEACTYVWNVFSSIKQVEFYFFPKMSFWYWL